MKSTRLILGLVLGSAIVALSGYGLFVYAKQHTPASDFPPALRETFEAHWMDGKGEVSYYELKQARYGEIHPGEMVVVFVHEPFSRKKLVKLDDPGAAGKDHVPVLKCLISTKFNTGLYPYSVQSVTQTSLEDGRLLKLTHTAQEWCGHTWLSLQRKGGNFQVEGRSYFESEGDQDFTLQAVWSEDGFWNLIRFDPWKLPTGTIDVIPSASYVRLRHKPLKPYAAQASLEKNETTWTYSLRFKAPEPRTVSWTFASAFPHQILGWEQEGVSGFGSKTNTLKTTATLQHQERLEYWSLNTRADTTARSRFGLGNTYPQ